MAAFKKVDGRVMGFLHQRTWENHHNKKVLAMSSGEKIKVAEFYYREGVQLISVNIGVLLDR